MGDGRAESGVAPEAAELDGKSTLPRRRAKEQAPPRLREAHGPDRIRHRGDASRLSVEVERLQNQLELCKAIQQAG